VTADAVPSHGAMTLSEQRIDGVATSHRLSAVSGAVSARSIDCEV